MKISYAITVCNEFKEIQTLLNFLKENKREQDEIVVLFDKRGGTPEVWSFLNKINVDKLEAATFKNHFADWKNYLNNLCSGDYIFQIDADEVPNKKLIDTLPSLLEGNSNIDLFLVPRVNTVDGLTQEHINKWRWNVNEKGWVNWPDYQTRIMQNGPKIKWQNKVHEQIVGVSTKGALPMEEEWCLYHPKDIKRQEAQNNFYDTLENIR